MTEKEIAQKAKEVFDSYCAMDSGELPDNQLSALQMKLSRWQTKNFKPPTAGELCLGVAEESGELAHVVLKNIQGLRGFEDIEKVREVGGDSMADAIVYMFQLATHWRLDLGTLIELTSEMVMQRNWIKDPLTGKRSFAAEEQAQPQAAAS